MEKEYDCIIIGAGNAGLITALELAKHNKSVLVLEKRNTPGGMSTSFKRGRFEFDTQIHPLDSYGTKEHPGEIFTLFNNLGIEDKIKLVAIPNAFHVYCKSEGKDYKLPCGIIEFMNQMEEYVPNSYDALKKFFVLAEESKEAMAYLEEKKQSVDDAYLKRNFPDFLKVSTHTVDQVFASLNLPKKAQEILSTFWIKFHLMVVNP